jgi:hypothetical protein
MEAISIAGLYSDLDAHEVMATIAIEKINEGKKYFIRQQRKPFCLTNPIN